ncbi:hypothetical protein [Terrimonas sp.]|uniref:hypothetical protein n=1 Tax=Terrimonas sp. TaxID=1914338 RepID=UPI00140228E0|nr:hypothetical protein [Terrimonas sp.]
MLNNILLLNGCRMEAESTVKPRVLALCRTCSVQPELLLKEVMKQKAPIKKV